MLISAALAGTTRGLIGLEPLVAALFGGLLVSQAIFRPMAYSRRKAPPSSWGAGICRSM